MTLCLAAGSCLSLQAQEIPLVNNTYGRPPHHDAERTVKLHRG